MAFGQQRFLGASIRGINAEMGWGEQPTSLTVSLVEDTRNGDSFNPPLVGRPVEFIFLSDPDDPYDEEEENAFYFAGILDNLSEDQGEGGNTLISATIVDPRRFLDGVQLIINGYSEEVTEVQNVYNIFSLYENIEYGSSLVNDLGMRSDMILNGLVTYMIGDIPNSISQKPIVFRGISYYLDLTEIPVITEDYRLGGNVINLLDFIQDCCDIANKEYIVQLIDGGLLGWIIKFRTISRDFVPSPTAVDDYISSVNGAINKSAGVEYTYNPSSKFLIGAPMDLTYFRDLALPSRAYTSVTITNDEGNEEVSLLSAAEWTDNGTIARFWGEDLNGNLIFGKRLEDGFDTDDEVITVSAREIGYATYTMTIGELKAASINQDAWESYIALNDYVGSIHEGKASLLQIQAEIKDDLQAKFRTRPLNQVPPHVAGAIHKTYSFNEETRQYVNKVYEFIRRYATDFFGVRYSVSIPNVLVKVDLDDFRLKETSLITTESGYLEDSEMAAAISSGLLPEYFSFVQNEEGKIIPYVKFDNFQTLDLSNLSRGIDYILDYDYVYLDDEVSVKTNVYIKCQVDNKIYFGNGFLGEDPRVVITLPGPIYRFEDMKSREFMWRDAWLKVLGRQPRDINGNEKDLKINVTKVFWANVGSDNVLYGMKATPVYPDLAVVPLRNTLKTYGPWFAAGVTGKVEVEYNQDLNPWNFGGFDAMNLVGTRLVEDILLSSIEGTNGALSLPGVTNFGPGAQIPGGGPYITGMNISIGSDGVTTSYRYGKWAVKTGKMLNYQVERFKKIYSIRRDQNKTIRDLYGNYAQNIVAVAQSVKEREKNRPRRERPNSSSAMLIGQSITRDNDNKKFSSVAAMPYYQVGQFIAEEFYNKGGISLDGIFRPFVVNENGVTIPKYIIEESRLLDTTTTTNSNGIINVYGVDSTALFPFKKGHDISVVFKGVMPTEQISNDIFSDLDTTTTPDGSTTTSTTTTPEDLLYRGVGLKGPVVMSGWGFDIDEKPCPAKLDDDDYKTEEFKTNYLNEYDNWKSGPIDFRWDEDRKVWAVPKENIIKIRNDSCGPRLKGEVLKICGEALTQYTNENQYLTDNPVNKILSGATTDGKDCFAILTNDVNGGYDLEGNTKAGIMAASISGKCVAKINIVNRSHRHASLVPGSTSLVSSVNGPVEILWSEGTGNQLCLVNISECCVTAPTTTTPEDFSLCQNECKFTYTIDGLNEYWTLVTDNCATSTTSTTTVEAPTTTTPEDFCGCRIITEDTATTTVECRCAYPSFCGNANGDCTYTSCTNGETQPINCSNTTTTSTTCDCATTSTADPGNPLAPNTCTYTYTEDGQTITLSNTCPEGCTCVGFPPIDSCEVGAVGCLCPPIDEDEPCSCGGYSKWFCGPDLLWRILENTC